MGMSLKLGELRVMLRNADSQEPFDLKTMDRADLLQLSRAARGTGGVQFIIGGKN